VAVLLKPYRIVSGRGATRNEFYLADCLDVFKQLPEASVDVIVTSPPYNLGIRYSTYEDRLDPKRYLEWTREWIAAAARVLAPAGSLFLNVGARPSDPWTALDVAQAARPHLRLQNIIHWVKSITIEQEAAGAAADLARDLSVGHYKPINSDRYVNDCHEFVFHFTLGGRTPLNRLALGVPYQDRSNIGRWAAAAAGIRCRGNTWFIPYETIQRRDRDRPHPATFPPRLPEQCLRLHGTSRIRVVMDPFTGLGSTGVACAKLGVNFIGVDVDATYLAEAVERLQQAISPTTSARTGARMEKAGLRPRKAAPSKASVSAKTPLPGRKASAGA